MGRLLRAELPYISIAGGLIVLAGLLAFVGEGRGGQVPKVTADSSAIVVLMDNQTPLPAEVFLKHDGAYDRLGACPPVARCLFVVPSARLGAMPSFQIAGLVHGEAVPDDSPVYSRTPGKVNPVGYKIVPGEAPALPKVPSEL